MADQRDTQPSGIVGPRGTVAQRRRFLAALALFLIWVAALAVTAVVSGRRPAPQAAGIEGR